MTISVSVSLRYNSRLHGISFRLRKPNLTNAIEVEGYSAIKTDFTTLVESFDTSLSHFKNQYQVMLEKW